MILSITLIVIWECDEIMFLAKHRETASICMLL
jgi:hypothetical protein